MVKTLAIGMTVGVRNNKGTIYDYCEQAAFSLRRAGFTESLHCFVEPGAEQHIPNPSRWNITMHQNEQKLGCFKNFRHSLRFLTENTNADWILMLQDDCIWRLDGSVKIHEAINTPSLQTVGFLSPYTSKAMVPAPQQKASLWRDKSAWINAKFHNKAFWGAVAMLFPRDSAMKLESESKRYREHKHHRKLDVVVGNAIRRELEMPIKVHVPSLCDHIGSWSTLGRHRFRGNQWGRRGFLFRTK